MKRWFTEPGLARRIVQWADLQPGMRVLEPSAGTGVFITPMLDHRGVSVEAVELDPELARKLTDDHQRARDLTVHNVDFLQWRPKVKFDLCVMNPPYEGGHDLRHVSHALDLCDRVVALVRLVFLSGVDRYELIWKHVVLKRQVNFINRPHFGGAGSPRHDFCVVDMHRPLVKPIVHRLMVMTEWWYGHVNR